MFRFWTIRSVPTGSCICAGPSVRDTARDHADISTLLTRRLAAPSPLIQAPWAAAGRRQVQKDEAIQSRQFTPVKERPEALRRVGDEEAKAINPDSTKATGRVKRPSSSRPPNNSSTPATPLSDINSVGETWVPES
jgi:hypothetical protein